MNPVENLLDKMLDLVRQKEKLMQEILQLSGRMVGADGDWEEIDKLLDTRKEYINRINLLDLKLKDLREKIVAQAGVGSWDHIMALYPQQTMLVESVLNKCSGMAFKAKGLTDQSRELAQSKITELERSIKKAQASKTGLSAYKKQSAQHDGYFIDKKK